MDASRKQQDSAEYILPARRLAGTRAEVLAEIDELIQGLVGLRQLVSLYDQEQPSDAPKRPPRLVPALLAALFVSGAPLWARPSPLGSTTRFDELNIPDGTLFQKL